MFSFAGFKQALVHVLGIGEEEAHQLVTAILTDLTPALATFKQEVVDAVKNAASDVEVDADKLAEDIAARVLANLGKTTPAAAS